MAATTDDSRPPGQRDRYRIRLVHVPGVPVGVCIVSDPRNAASGRGMLQRGLLLHRELDRLRSRPRQLGISMAVSSGVPAHLLLPDCPDPVYGPGVSEVAVAYGPGRGGVACAV